MITNTQRACLLAVMTLLACPAFAQNADLNSAGINKLAERKAMVKIINATIDSGSWRGKLEGTVDMELRRQLGPGVVKDTWLETSTIGHFEDPSCKRVSMHYYFTLRKSDTPQTIMKQLINICRDLELPSASNEEIARVVKNSVNQNELKHAKITPYTDDEEKSHYVRLLRKAISQPGMVFREPMMDEQLKMGFMSTFGTSGSISLIMTVVGEVPQQNCARVRIDSITDHPFTLTGGVTAIGFRQEINACAHGNYSEPVPAYPTYLFVGADSEIISAEEKKAIAAARKAGTQSKPTANPPAQGKTTATKPPAAKLTGTGAQGPK